MHQNQIINGHAHVFVLCLDGHQKWAYQGEIWHAKVLSLPKRGIFICSQLIHPDQVGSREGMLGSHSRQQCARQLMRPFYTLTSLLIVKLVGYKRPIQHTHGQSPTVLQGFNPNKQALGF